MNPRDIEIISGYLGCEIAVLQAVLKVETSGSGFHQGLPIILNEPHVFYRELSGKKRDLAVKRGLAYPKWGTRSYPRTQKARYDWLSEAKKIDETAALKSCSWGLGQVMGFNFALCGFDNVQQFVAAMHKSEGHQLWAMARFIVSNGLQGRLRKKDWAGFARGYNGAGYAKNRYHTKLAHAYAHRPKVERVVPPAPSAADLLSRYAARPPETPSQPPSPPVQPRRGVLWRIRRFFRWLLS